MQIFSLQQNTLIKKRSKRLPKFIKAEQSPLTLQHLGDIILVFGICCSTYLFHYEQQIPNIYEPFLTSCFYYFALSIAGPFTGGHLNPIITVIMYCREEIPKQKIKFYFIGQISGGLIGAFSGYLIYQVAPAPYIKNQSFQNILYDCLGEIVGSFLFTFLLLYCLDTNQMKVQYFNYFFISIIYLISRIFTMRKGIINPLVALSLQITSALNNSNIYLIFYSIGLIIGEIIGSILGYLFFKKFYFPLIKQIQSNQKKKI